MPRCFKLHCSYSHIIVTLQSYIGKNGKMVSLRRKRLLFSYKYKATFEVELGEKPSKVAEKYGAPRNTVSTWLLSRNKEKLKTFSIWNTTNSL